MNVAFQDGNWILHKTFSVMKKGSDELIAKAILSQVCNYALRLNCQGAVMLFDGGNNFRYAVDPNYKSNRGGSGPVTGETDPRDMYSLLEPITRLFNLVRFPIYQRAEYEADDLCSAGAVYHASLSKKNVSWIVNHDKDAFQTVTDRIHVYWPRVGQEVERIFNDAAVWTRTGFYPRQFAEFQILTGDSIDCIPAIVKPAVAKKILKEHDSLKAYFATEEGRKFFLRNEQRLRKNLRLVRMDMKSWDPEEMNYDLSRLEDSRTAWKEFGDLPSSFHHLRIATSSTTKKRSLF